MSLKSKSFPVSDLRDMFHRQLTTFLMTIFTYPPQSIVLALAKLLTPKKIAQVREQERFGRLTLDTCQDTCPELIHNKFTYH